VASLDSADEQTISTVSEVITSKYRVAVGEHLLENGPGTPTGIADSVDEKVPHVSRALQELKEKGVVELLVPEARRKGRIYALTDTGSEVMDLAVSMDEHE